MHKVAGVVLMIGMSCMSALGASPEAPQYAPLEVCSATVMLALMPGRGSAAAST